MDIQLTFVLECSCVYLSEMLRQKEAQVDRKRGSSQAGAGSAKEEKEE